jgi:hypothetical protein
MRRAEKESLDREKTLRPFLSRNSATDDVINPHARIEKESMCIVGHHFTGVGLTSEKEG